MGFLAHSVAAHDNARVALALCPLLSRMDQCPADTFSAMFRIDDQTTNLSEARHVQKLAWHQVDPAHDAMVTQLGYEHSMSFLFGQRRQLPLGIRI